MTTLIEAKNVTRTFHGEAVVDCVSMSVEVGECVVILGPSGAGKSTVLRCLAGIDELASGEVIYRDDVLVTSEGTQKTLSGDIGMVFQQFNLFPHLTSIENVMLAPRTVRRLPASVARQEAAELLKSVGLGDRENHYPEELSGGQQQRVAIARALAMKPTLLLFDEPTSSLDPEYTREVLEVMKRLVGTGITVVVVTHEMEFARQSADRVVFMDAGRIVEVTPTEQFFSAPQTDRAATFLAQMDGRSAQ
jgi:ABC-type polar amino acid transport system ATPase subunit